MNLSVSIQNHERYFEELVERIDRTIATGRHEVVSVKLTRARSGAGDWRLELWCAFCQAREETSAAKLKDFPALVEKTSFVTAGCKFS